MVLMPLLFFLFFSKSSAKYYFLIVNSLVKCERMEVHAKYHHVSAVGDISSKIRAGKVLFKCFPPFIKAVQEIR